ncbi:MAG: hypothetical protein EZS28_043244 [Streblomastix strix]|uniref:Uncharacterized protein n=1 Tax=Streblomastix strix TaxID=222440 RepID=A0A5J4TT98_9EUKA|nr:MAG: hypothetical protein EZS28_043244 [Streblomastix strix]
MMYSKKKMSLLLIELFSTLDDWAAIGVKDPLKQCKQIINTPNFLNSLIKLTEFKSINDTNKEKDNQSIQIRNKSKGCFHIIHYWGDEQAQVELVTNGYPRLLVIDINTADGNEQQQEDSTSKEKIEIEDAD